VEEEATTGMRIQSDQFSNGLDSSVCNLRNSLEDKLMGESGAADMSKLETAVNETIL
jgi:hypothetical protein